MLQPTGKVVGALSERINLPPTVEDVEALACRRAIVFAIELGLHHVVFEGDSATVINHLQEDTPCLASFGNAIADSQSPWHRSLNPFLSPMYVCWETLWLIS